MSASTGNIVSDLSGRISGISIASSSADAQSSSSSSTLSSIGSNAAVPISGGPVYGSWTNRGAAPTPAAYYPHMPAYGYAASAAQPADTRVQGYYPDYSRGAAAPAAGPSYAQYGYY